jgi:hypothetical protein
MVNIWKFEVMSFGPLIKHLSSLLKFCHTWTMVVMLLGMKMKCFCILVLHYPSYFFFILLICCKLKKKIIIIIICSKILKSCYLFFTLLFLLSQRRAKHNFDKVLKIKSTFFIMKKTQYKLL